MDVLLAVFATVTVEVEVGLTTLYLCPPLSLFGLGFSAVFITDVVAEWGRIFPYAVPIFGRIVIEGEISFELFQLKPLGK